MSSTTIYLATVFASLKWSAVNTCWCLVYCDVAPGKNSTVIFVIVTQCNYYNLRVSAPCVCPV